MSHVVIFEEYFNIMQSKEITKAKGDEIIECKQKERKKGGPKR
jgi:hypothetical protein